MNVNRRYPGSHPFQDTELQRKLFLGRSREIKALSHLILAEELVLLYAKSGVGKTSLLNAGILQRLRDKEFFPIVIRLGLGRSQRNLITTIQKVIREKAQEERIEVDGPHTEFKYLWDFFCELKFWRGDILLTPILIFDQFEELFSIVEEAPRKLFIQQFAQLAQKNSPHLSSDSGSSLIDEKGMPLKIVVALREDYLGEIEHLAAEVPQIMYNRFRLTPLTREQAKDAICGPAAFKDERISTQNFSYHDDAIENLLYFLCTKRERQRQIKGNEVEPFQLQIICQHIEDKVSLRQQQNAEQVVIRSEDLGGTTGMEEILKSFYINQVSEFPEREQGKIRRLCEKGLISATEKRLSLEEEEIDRQYGVNKSLLGILVERRVLRAESRVGSVYYELSHDTLVSPILRSHRARDVETIFRNAQKERANGNYQKAVDLYSKIIELDKSETRAYIEQAALFMEQGRHTQAIEQLLKGEAHAVANQNLYHLLGKAHAERGDYKKAIDYYQKSIQLNDKVAAVYIDLGDALTRSLQQPQARPEDYKRMIRHDRKAASSDDKGAVAQSDPGDAPIKDSQLVQAISYYQKAFEIDPQNPNVYRQLALLEINRRKYTRALDFFNQALEANTGFAYIFEELVEELIVEGAQDVANQICQRTLSIESEDHLLYFHIGFVLGKLNDFDSSIRAYEKSSELFPEGATFNNWGWSQVSWGGMRRQWPYMPRSWSWIPKMLGRIPTGAGV